MVNLCAVIQQAKVPDIEKCLDAVATLQAKKGTGEVRFLTVNCFLGAIACFVIFEILV